MSTVAQTNAANHERETLALFLALDRKRWSEASRADKEEALEYRRSLHAKLKKNVGRFAEIDYLRELEHYVKTLTEKKLNGGYLLPTNANDTYLEELEILNECLGL